MLEFILFPLITIIVCVVFCNLIEYLAHKYILHELGKDKKSYWAAHWNRHHKVSRKLWMVDRDYLEKWWEFKPRQSEVIGLFLLWLFGGLPMLLLPVFIPALLLISIVWCVTVAVYCCSYYYIHKKSHLNTQWAFKWLPWHVDHHLGKDQDKNWNVTFPLWDIILRTRVDYNVPDKRRRRSKHLSDI